MSWKNYGRGMVTFGDFWPLAQIYKNNGTKSHSEDQFRLCHPPEVNTPFKKAGVHVQEFSFHVPEFFNSFTLQSFYTH